MVSARSDKFNDQMGTATVRSHSSQLDLGADRMLYVDGPSFSTDSSIDQNATTRSIPGGQPRECGWPHHLETPSAGSSETSGFPKYTLRIIPPKHELAKDAYSKPDPNHIPGSSPAEGDVAANWKRNMQAVNHEGHGDDTLNLDDHLGLIIENSTAAATTALNAISEHDHMAEKQPPNIDSGAKSALQEHNPIIDDAQGIPRRSSSLHTIGVTLKEGEKSETAPLLPKQSLSSTFSQAEDRTRRSPVSRALSVVSPTSDRPHSAMQSSSLLTPSRRRSSLARPSESQYKFITPSLGPTFNRENWTNKGISEAVNSKGSQELLAATTSTNLTARPSRFKGTDVTERIPSIHARRPWTDDTKSISRAGADSKDSLHMVQRQQTNDQSFSKAIVDLENLLTEALSMAGNEADSNKLGERSQPIPKDLWSESEQLRVADTKKPNQRDPTRHGRDGNEISSPTNLSAEKGPLIQLKLDNGGSGIDDENPEVGRSLGSTARAPGMFSCNGQDPGALVYHENTKSDSEVNDATQSVRSHSASLHVAQTTLTKDWAVEDGCLRVSTLQIQQPANAQASYKEKQELPIHKEGHGAQQRPPHIQSRSTSLRMPGKRRQAKEVLHSYDTITSSGGSESDGLPYVADYVTAALQYHPIVREISSAASPHYAKDPIPASTRGGSNTSAPLVGKEIKNHASRSNERGAARKDFNLKDRHHFSIREPHGFSLSRSHRRRPIARDWSTSRKRFVATVTCITTSLMGLVLGIYAGEVPAIQYTLADEHHYTILGNVVFFLGLAITTLLLWPLPLLHGRKPYTLAALAILLPLQFPQGLAVNGSRSPDAASSRVGILLPRALSGLVMGFANINFMTTLLDLFGASLQSGNPHQEVVDENDVRRHGGGIGAWLGIWTWCSIMSIGLGFLIGAGIISGISVAWGFWLTILLNAVVLVLNVMVPEVRRSPYRRSMAEVRTGTDVSRRVARGEIKMHLESTGPKNWYEEVSAGHVLCVRMLKQPGFLILAFYQGWIYGQVVMIVVVSSFPSNFSIQVFECEGNVAAAIRSIAIEVLQFPPSICWTRGCLRSTRRLTRCSFPKGRPLQPGKAPQAED